MIACCGLDCSTCECFMATQADDGRKREEVSKKWSAMFKSDIRPDQINCDGCKAQGRKFIFSENVCEIRKCCMTRGEENCAKCEAYMCETLKRFIKSAPKVGAALESLRKSYAK